MKCHSTVRKISTLLSVAVLVFCSYIPIASFAQEPAITTPTYDQQTTTDTTNPPTQQPTTPTSNGNTPLTEQGPQQPTGPEASTYTFNESTGLWENDVYTWDPVTKKTSPKQQPTYSYNPASGMWDTTEWVYDAPSKKYVPQTVSLPPAAADEHEADLQATPKESSKNAYPAIAPSTKSAQPSGSIEKVTNNSGMFDLFYNASISNTITSVAQSGNASVTQNTLGGSAISGDASAAATVLSLLQSGWDPSGIATFSTAITGDVYGDLFIDPTTLPTVSTTNNTDLQVRSENNNDVTNDISLTATSGDALVQNNTNAGDATSGNAIAAARLITMIGSFISSGQSFIGNVTIDGTLDGDILLPEGTLERLLASQNSSNTNQSATTITANEQTDITNNVVAHASSGAATVEGNTSGGSATSGMGQTKVNIINLTGQQVIAKNALIVFVNVFGTWNGLIVNAPQGATAAVLGGGVTNNQTKNANATLETSTNNTITNNVSVNAQTGDASVASNTAAGNATSGDAYASVDIANISQSAFSLSEWFGVLFINILGGWHGSFGIDTEAGELPVVAVPQKPIQASSQSQPKVLSHTTSSTGIQFHPTQGTPNNAAAPTQDTPTTPSTPTAEEMSPTQRSNDEAFEQKVQQGNTLRNITITLSAITILALLAEELLRRRRLSAA